MKDRLRGKVALITGGSGVLCSAMAKGLAGAGAKVALLGRSLDKVEAVASEIRGSGGEALALSADVTKKDELAAARARLLDAWGSLDLVVCGAGGNKPGGTTSRERSGSDPSAADFTGQGSFFAMEEDALRYVFDLNFMGSLLPCQVFGADLAGKKGASIIFISSMGSFSPMTKVPAYCAAKAAINNLTQWMAVHFAEAGIRVNAIAPGFFSTEQNKHLLWNPDGSPSPRTARIIDHTPMRRLGLPEDLVGPLLWLCDESSSGFVTGAVIPVDGGFMAYSGV
jgi:Dehydrogenases with different specificities (related to short-chain alcohol dehydrogenases)